MLDILSKNLSKDNLRHFFSMDNITHYLSHLYLIILIWCTLYGIDYESAKPFDGHIFHLLIIFVVGFTFGELMAVFNLPPLLGMLITGFVLGNVIQLNLNPSLSTLLRNTALVIILLRAGLELDPIKISHLSGVCVRLSFSPCIVEAITIAITSNLLLGLPIIWGFLMGFVLAAVSPAVVVSGVIALQEKGYGIDKGIPTLLMASSSVDDILAISGVMLFVRIVFDSNSPFIWLILKGPMEALIGVMFGIMFGLILWYIPSEDSMKAMKQRVLLLILSGVFVKFGSKLLDIESAGPLGCLVVAFIAAYYWRTHKLNKPIQRQLKIFWTVFQPLLFGLIGTEVNIRDLKSSRIAIGLVCLMIALFMRCLTAMVVVYGANLNMKEKLFIALAWLPKATVQAALGPIALDMARQKGDQDNIANAEFILTIAVLSIIITAPLGSVAIALCGPKLLNKLDKSTSISQKNKHDHIEEEDDDDED